MELPKISEIESNILRQDLEQDSRWSQGPERKQEVSGTLRDVSQPAIEPGSQELTSCALAAGPPLHDTTGRRHRAFKVFQGSCYRTPFDLSFWLFLTFLHHGIAEVERHFL